MGDEITYRQLGLQDVAILQAVPEGLFDNPVDPGQAKAFLEDPMHHMVLAFAGNLAVGMATGTILLHPDKQPTMFINEVGVRETWQRRGIGAGVTSALIAAARDAGCHGIWLGTEPDNAPALALYRKLKGDEQPGVYFCWDDAL